MHKIPTKNGKTLAYSEKVRYNVDKEAERASLEG